MNIIRINSTESHLVIPLFDQYRSFYKQPSDPDLARRYIEARLDRDESTIFVAMAEGTAIGFVQLYPLFSSVRAARDWILNDLFVEQAFRGRQVGLALIRTALRFAREQGGTFVELETAVDNVNAQRLYEGVGFARRQVCTDYLTYRIDPRTTAAH